MQRSGEASRRPGRRTPVVVRLAAIVLLSVIGGCAGGDAAAPVETGAAPDAAALRALLAAEFDRLGIDPKKVPAVAPSGAANAVFDLDGEIHEGDPPIVVFSWTERMLGDFNQDGLVGVSDLTPIGQRYDETVDYDDPATHGGITHWPTGDPDDAGAANWRLARVDGNDDGLIYLSDITTIAQHWEERISGYRLYYQTPSMSEFELLPNPGEPGSPLTIPRSVADPEDPALPFRYVLSYAPPDEEGFYQFYVAPYDDSTDTEGTPSPVLTLPDGEPPTAALTAAPLYGNPPMTVVFDASDSVDSDGEIIGYAWDFYGSGFFSTHTDEPHAENVYTGSDTYTASVRVEDSQHLLDTASIEITTNTPPVAVITASPAEPSKVPVIASFSADGSSDPNGEIMRYDWDFGDDGSWELVDGGPIPAIAYPLNVPGEYTTRVKVFDNDGMTDTATATVTGLYGEWSVQTVDAAFTDAGEGCSLALVDGRPAIGYYHMGQKCLMFARAFGELGTGVWPAPLLLTPSGDPDEGQYPSLAVIDGNPAIAYYDFGEDEVRYIRASNSSGSDWPDLTITVFPNLGTNITLCEVEGWPAVTYLTEGMDVYYQRATINTGGVWTDLPRDIDGSGYDHWGPRLSIIDGFPAVAYMRTATGKTNLMYVRATEAAGTEPWDDPVPAYSHAFDSVGYRGSLAQLAGNPAVFFPLCEDGGWYGQPRIVRSQSATGAEFTWTSPSVPIADDEGPSADYHNSLAVINGLPHVVFHDPESSSLWHAWGKDPQGTEWLAPVVVDDGAGNDVGAFCSLADINGHAAVAYHDNTAGTLKYAVLH